MKKFKVIAFILAIVVFVFVVVTSAYAWYNKSLFDTTWHFDRAIITLADSGSGNGETFYIEGPVDSWTDFEGSDTIQVKINGVVYLTHSSNVVLISD